MNWAAFGGPEFFIPGGIQIEARCPLSRNITEWYQEQGGQGEGRLCVLISLPREASPITQNAFSLVLFYDYHQPYLREQQRVRNVPHRVSESEVHELLP